MYDVVVVGGRCAGSATALGFARAGRSVLLMEQARFPRDTISTHHVHQPGLVLLQQWGVLPELLRTDCPANEKIVYHVENRIRIVGTVPRLPGIDGIYAPRRHVLDTVLAEAATSAGADFAQQTTVTDVVFEADRAVGVRYRTRGGVERTVRAHLVVGADGKHSRVARACRAAVQEQRPMLTCAYYGYWSELPADFEMYVRTGSFVATVRTHDDLTLVACYLPIDTFARARKSAMAVYLGAIEAATPALADRLAQASLAERLRGTGDQPNFFRRPVGPGWALVGDAGCAKDSITGTGITDAFRQAGLLVDCVRSDLGDRTAVDEGLRVFGGSRDDLMRSSFDAAIAVGRLRVSPELLTRMENIQRSPAASNVFAAVAAGAVAFADGATGSGPSARQAAAVPPPDMPPVSSGLE